MKEIKPYSIEQGESYLVATGYEWSPSGFDIAKCIEGTKLISQTNGENLLTSVRKVKIYELPVVD